MGFQLFATCWINKHTVSYNASLQNLPVSETEFLKKLIDRICAFVRCIIGRAEKLTNHRSQERTKTGDFVRSKVFGIATLADPGSQYNN